jgi:predicted DNA-binding WGR domain protein
MNTLIKIDPEKHMYRWYAVGIQSTLIDGIAVIYGWGSLKSTFQQWRTIRVSSQKEAEEIVKRILAYRQKKGYIHRMKGGI